MSCAGSKYMSLSPGSDAVIWLEEYLKEARRAFVIISHDRQMLNAVAERIGWNKPAPKGVYRGLAQTMGFPGRKSAPEVQKVVCEAIATITAAGKIAGYACEEETKEFLARGVRYFHTGMTPL